MKHLMMSKKSTMLLLLSARLTAGQTDGNWPNRWEMTCYRKERTDFQEQLATRAVFVGWRIIIAVGKAMYMTPTM